MHLGQHLGQHVGQHLGAASSGPVVLAPTLPICVHLMPSAIACAVAPATSVLVMDSSIHVLVKRGPCD